MPSIPTAREIPFSCLHPWERFDCLLILIQRVFVVLVRKDICPNQAVAKNIGEMVSKVIPHAFDSPHGGQADRETVQQLMAYNRAVLSDLGREPTFPPPSQDGSGRGVQNWFTARELWVPGFKVEAELITIFSRFFRN